VCAERGFVATFCCVVLIGLSCAGTVVRSSSPSALRLAELTQDIEALGPAVHTDEAQLAATEALRATSELARAYRMTRPAQVHNVLVHIGLRQRGLCCHWAEDLVARMNDLDLSSLEVHWVVASRGSLLREHSSVLLVPTGHSFEQGLVLDGWRDSGNLVWVRPVEDRYAWSLHPLDGQWDRLRCL